MRIGIACAHGGFELKTGLAARLREQGHQVVDFGAELLKPGDDYPDTVLPLARAVSGGEVERGIAVCGSGVGACIAANKVPGVRAGLVTEGYSAHQGVEDDDMNVLCLGGRVTGLELALELVDTFLQARFSGEPRFKRRLAKITAVESGKQGA
jgi:ribose 5-phosphate isomerase B